MLQTATTEKLTNIQQAIEALGDKFDTSKLLEAIKNIKTEVNNTNKQQHKATGGGGNIVSGIISDYMKTREEFIKHPSPELAKHLVQAAKTAATIDHSKLGWAQQVEQWAKSNGYADGGYTGTGGKYDVAGVVHKDEYVLPSSMKAMFPLVDRLRTGGQVNVGIDMKPLVAELRELRREVKELKQTNEKYQKKIAENTTNPDKRWARL